MRRTGQRKELAYEEKKIWNSSAVLLAFALLLTGCAGAPEEPKTDEQEQDTSSEILKADGTIRILSGSENEELEMVIDECSQQPAWRLRWITRLCRYHAGAGERCQRV